MLTAENTTKRRESKRTSDLLPIRHPNLDFFLCDIIDCTPKDDQESMEHPMFSLSTKKDMKARHYEHNGNTIDIEPGYHGLATIFDKDILLYCESQIMEAFNRGRDDFNRKVRATAYDLLVATNRQTSGEGYKGLQAALNRLQGTNVRTNIQTNGVRIREGFGLIDSWRIVERSPTDERMISIEITLSEWLYNALLANQVLSINRDYFRLRKPLERRLYELARKHCGHQASWTISLDLLWKKSGSGSKRNRFREHIKAITKANHIPDYRIVFNEEKDQVTFYNRSPEGHQKQIEAIKSQD